MRSLVVPIVAGLAALAVLVGPAGACSSSISKRPARPAAPAPAAPPPPRTNVTFPTYKCPQPYSEFYCLNDAKCFTIIIQDNPLYNCECKDGFVGQRCEYKDLDGSYLLSRGRLMLETASIAGGASVAILLVLLLCLAAWLRSRSRGKRPPCEEALRAPT